MNKTAIQKIMSHPDFREILGKLVIDISPADISSWLAEKYTNVAEKKFLLSEKSLKTFKDSYLDIYSLVQEDIRKTKIAIATNTEDRLALAINNNPLYKSKVLETMTKEMDVRKMVANLCVAIETRAGQIFDEIQSDPRNINTKIDRVFIEYCEVLQNALEKFYKFTEGSADLTIRHNISYQVVDRHISVIQDVIKGVLAEIDLDASMLFMDRVSEAMQKLKMPVPEAGLNTDMKVAEAKLLSETIDKKLNGK